jgi:Flp pilus assembly pilin Flp
MRDLMTEHDVPTTTSPPTERFSSTIASLDAADSQQLLNVKGGVTRMFTFLYALRNREEGQALVEYALILALVSVVAIGTLTAIGTGVDGILGQVAAAL